MKRVPADFAGRRILGMTFEGEPIFEPANAGASLVLAAAGGGKTTCVTVPAVQCLLASSSPRAILINDVKDGEVASQVGAMCVKHGRKFGAVDEFEVLGCDYPFRLSLNAFGAAVTAFRNESPDLPFIIENITHALIDEPKDDERNFYWRESARERIDFALRALLDRSPRLTFPGGLHALLADPKLWSHALKNAAKGNDISLAAPAKQILELKEQNPEHDAQHLGAALTATKMFSYGPLANAGRLPDLSHADLIRDAWVVCFVNPVRHADRLGPFFALHFLALMDAQLRGGAGGADYILDEFCNAPLREKLNRITIERGFGARTIYLAQSRQDIVRRYGEKETAILEENCTVKQYLKISNFDEASRIAKAMGEALHVSSGLGLTSDNQSFSRNLSTGHGCMFSADELMRLPPNEQIIHIAGLGWIHCLKNRQNQNAPYCYDLTDNRIEGGRLPPDPKILLPTPGLRP
ncbi:MAG: type IV secretory system conjugative DNA transfer family protein [Rhizobiales bacterium]|nr:type IV secretory system conjugative DNA transfer family protein [Hyphomicrobiales bacterium]